jgi:ArsR family transcriptional regulator, arsenate/arsenite/antimonite-responsive transcriptional repressor
VEPEQAIAAFSALAQGTRLQVFRLLVQAGPNGMNAGDIAEAVDALPSTMSHHLGGLERAGLAVSRRDGRSVIYAVDYEGTRRLIAFLTEDCCEGRPELCGTGFSAASIRCE